MKSLLKELILRPDNITLLKKRCNMKAMEFKPLGHAVKHDKTFHTKEHWAGPEEELFSVFIDNGSDVLAIAHLDTVQFPYYHGIIITQHEARVFASSVDDRLGAFIILDLLPQLGCKYDILLTTGEECGKSTAEYFKPKKQYNWMFSFDRMKDDCVVYDYMSQDFRELLEGFEFKVERGMGSDICYLEHLKCKGFNVGNGMNNYHEWWGYADLRQTESNIKKFLKFYEKMKDTYLPHEKKTYTSWGGKDSTRYFRDGKEITRDEFLHKSTKSTTTKLDGKTLDAEFDRLTVYAWDKERKVWLKTLYKLFEEMDKIELKGGLLISPDGVVCPTCLVDQEFILGQERCQHCGSKLMYEDAMMN